MRKHILLYISIFIFGWNANLFSQESDLISILKAPAASGTLTNEELFRKADALRQLTWTGSPSSAPAIAPFLRDERLSTHARTALMNLPNGAGIEVLRREAETLKGIYLVGAIDSLGSVRDVKAVPLLANIAKTNDPAAVKAACFALGRIGNDAAVDVLTTLLRAQKSEVREAAARAILQAVAARAAKDGDTERIAKVLASDCSEFVKANLRQVSACAESKDATDSIEHGLASDDPVIFNRALPLLVERGKRADVGPMLATWGKLSEVKRIKIFNALAAHNCKVNVTSLASIVADRNQSDSLRAAAARCLGGPESNADTIAKLIIPLLSSEKIELIGAALDVLGKTLSRPKEDAIVQLVRTGSPLTRSSAVRAIRAIHRGQSPGSGFDAVKAALGDPDASVRVEAYDAYAVMSEARLADLQILVNRVQAKARPDESSALREAIFLIGKRTPEPAVLAAWLKEQFTNASSDMKAFYYDVLAQIGNHDALHAIIACTKNNDDASLAKATQILGEWTNLEAAPFLLEIAKSCPIEKYRIRAIRGYIRLVRQMGRSADQQVQMADAVAPLVTRKEEKELLRGLYSRIEGQRKDKLIFDGQTFNGWEGDTKNVFRIENGCIVGGSLKAKLSRNEFLCTVRPYTDFTLTLECKIIGEGGNAGIQFRSVRIPDNHEMLGYQADMTTDGKYWGSLYDESRRKKFLAQADPEAVAKVYRPGQWNRYKIVCWGARVKLFLNDVQLVDYYEKEDVARTGVIGLQIHGGPPSEAWYRNIRIENYELIQTP